MFARRQQYLFYEKVFIFAYVDAKSIHSRNRPFISDQSCSAKLFDTLQSAAVSNFRSDSVPFLFVAFATMLEICMENLSLGPNLDDCSPSSSTSSLERPFKLMVKSQVFTVDSEKMRRLSPIFELMCFGRDFEGGRELAREIVDEKENDIDTFLRCLYDHAKISGKNKRLI